MMDGVDEGRILPPHYEDEEEDQVYFHIREMVVFFCVSLAFKNKEDVEN
jgi:hypothetical protein